MSTAGISHRQIHMPASIGSIADGLEGCLTVALIRIQSIRRSRGCGAWLFVDREGRVYVLSDEASALPGMLREHPGWLVGYYCEREIKRNSDPVVTLELLAGDIEAHMPADFNAAA